jgi:protein-disulfide isomerase
MSEKKSKKIDPAATSNAIIIGLSVLLVIFIILFINEKTAGSKGGAIVSPLPDSFVILTYNGGSIKAGEIKESIDPRIAQLQEEVVEMYKKGAENILVEKLLNDEVAKKGLPNITALLEGVGTNVQVSDAEVKAFIKENNLEKGFQDPNTGQMRKVSDEEIRAHLISRVQVSERQGFIENLIQTANIQWKLKEPMADLPAFLAEEPVLGNRNAKVVIYEHSDFQCPYCSRGNSIMKEVLQAYGDKVAIVFRHLPLDFHPEARPAALASTCAHQEGKFAEYKDLLFSYQKELSAENYVKWAKEIGLDEAKFKACYESPKTAEIVDRSIGFSEQVGASSTPTYFIGSKIQGKKVPGAQPFSEFKKLIDAELR